MTKFRALDRCALALIVLALAGCGGGPPVDRAPAAPSGANIAPDAAAITIPLTRGDHTASVFLPGGITGRVTLRSDGSVRGAKVLLNSAPALAAEPAAQLAGRAQGQCPTNATITLVNPLPWPITVQLTTFTVTLPCSVNGMLFGVSFYQVIPQPATLEPQKLGDATASGNTITFTPTATQLTLPAQTTDALTILPEKSTADVAFDVVPGSTTVLTANAPSVPSSLSFAYAKASGASQYQAACFNAYDANGHLVPPLRGVPFEGKPSFYCRFDPSSGPVTFGTTVKFYIAKAQPDASVLELDGRPQEFLCSAGPLHECDTPSFTIPAVQNAIAGNAQDIHVCVPAQVNADCNNIANVSPPPAAATSVPPNSPVQLLVADDPTYKAPNFGGFTLTIPAGSACLINNGPDENGDGPSGYSDPGGPQETPPVYGGRSTHATFDGFGPDVEFDIHSGASGTCAVTVTELTGLMRSTTFRIPIAAQ